jgi:hypothetical protein
VPMSPTIFPMKAFSLSGLTSMMASLEYRWAGGRPDQSGDRPRP